MEFSRPTRLVSLDDIVATLEFPTRTTGLPVGKPGRRHWSRTERGRDTHVVFEVWDDGTVYVVTVFRRPG